MAGPTRRVAAVLACSAVALALVTLAAARSLVDPAVTELPRPNIVYIMLDDLPTDVVPYMEAVQDMADEGVTFSNFIVSNSLCCPSRAGYLTGKYPHNNLVLGNKWPLGGVGKFFENDLNESIGVYLDRAGYRTGLLGKYLNHYDPAGFDDGPDGQPDYPPAYMPPGWDEVWIPENGYQHFAYPLTDGKDGVSEVVQVTGEAEANYVTDRLAAEAEDFIDRNADEPFFLTLTPFAIHFGIGMDPERGTWFPAAPRDRPDGPTRPSSWAAAEFPRSGDCGGTDEFGGCADVVFPARPEIYNRPIENAVDWMPTQPLNNKFLARIEDGYYEQVRMAQSVDDMIDRVRHALVEAGVDENTYLVFGSDNGFHLGDHALFEGKTTPYDHDVRLPFVVVPPGGVAARTETEIVSNVDLLPTFAEIAGVTTFDEPVDGASFRHLIDDTSRPGEWRKGALIQHAGGEGGRGNDPDQPSPASVVVPPYRALRTETYLYTDYSPFDQTAPAVGRGEYFDLVNDPFQTVNIYAELSPTRRSALNAALQEYAACAGETCWSAGLSVP